MVGVGVVTQCGLPVCNQVSTVTRSSVDGFVVC